MKNVSWLLALMSTIFLAACTKETPTEVKSTSDEPVVKVTPVDSKIIEIEVAEEAVKVDEEELEEEESLIEEVEDADEVNDEDDADEIEDEEDEDENEAIETLIEEVGTDGSFSYETSYATPKGETLMMVNFDVNEGIISSFKMTGNPKHELSIQHQALFQTEAGDYILGKTVETITPLPAVLNGSSLTSSGFNKALLELQKES